MLYSDEELDNMKVELTNIQLHAMTVAAALGFNIMFTENDRLVEPFVAVRLKVMERISISKLGFLTHSALGDRVDIRHDGGVFANPYPECIKMFESYVKGIYGIVTVAPLEKMPQPVVCNIANALARSHLGTGRFSVAPGHQFVASASSCRCETPVCTCDPDVRRAYRMDMLMYRRRFDITVPGNNYTDSTAMSLGSIADEATKLYKAMYSTCELERYESFDQYVLLKKTNKASLSLMYLNTSSVAEQERYVRILLVARALQRMKGLTLCDEHCVNRAIDLVTPLL